MVSLFNTAYGALSDVAVEWNTTFECRDGLCLDDGGITTKASNIHYLWNLQDRGQGFGMKGSGQGEGSASFWDMNDNITSEYSGNVWWDNPGGVTYPANHIWAASKAAVQFTKLAPASLQNFTLSGSSPYKSIATGGFDVGANIPMVLTFTSNSISPQFVAKLRLSTNTGSASVSTNTQLSASLFNQYDWPVSESFTSSYSSSNAAVATVSATGLVSFVGAGVVTITGSYSSSVIGMLIDSCSFTVI